MLWAHGGEAWEAKLAGRGHDRRGDRIPRTAAAHLGHPCAIRWPVISTRLTCRRLVVVIVIGEPRAVTAAEPVW